MNTKYIDLLNQCFYFPQEEFKLEDKALQFHDRERTKVSSWSYFYKVSDSTTSCDSYSGAVPKKKITWMKLDVDTPEFIIENGATIVTPLVFDYLLDM